MLCFKREKNNGEIEFIPFYEGCAYLHCSCCGKFIPIFDLSEYLADFGAGDDRTFYYDTCEDCLDKKDRLYKDYTEKCMDENSK